MVLYFLFNRVVFNSRVRINGIIVGGFFFGEGGRRVVLGYFELLIIFLEVFSFSLCFLLEVISFYFLDFRKRCFV